MGRSPNPEFIDQVIHRVKASSEFSTDSYFLPISAISHAQ
ncbi:hypothetical protein HMPREF9061_01181 [Actinomyces sp. oral taxon 181 str. F0379]|nr:hypothetical protein HMPREF9061_01181 [Actinomyces sp. oral taxon 181 str. F0379]